MPSKIYKALLTYKEALKIPQVRKKLLFTVIVLFWFRLLAHLPAPGIDASMLKNFFSQNQFFALLDIFSGGTLANFSLIALGLNPYINALVMFQLLGFVFPQINELRKEGEYGRKKLAQWTRMLTIPLSAMQAVGMYFLLRGQGLVNQLSVAQIAFLVISMVAGTMILVFLGELVNQYGVGNGISLIIFTGIVSRYPISIYQVLSTSQQVNFFQIITFVVLAVLLITGIVLVDESFLKVPIQYARRISGGRTMGSQQSYLPLKVNASGVMPIIFASSLMILPSMLSGLVERVQNDSIAGIAQTVVGFLNPSGLPYNLIYFFLVVLFTYFYTTVVFNPEEVSEQLRKSGGFIPGVRPGVSTKKRLSFLLSRVTIIGAVFLGLVAVLPSLGTALTGISAITLGGTSILIVVSVILELHRLLDNLVQTWRYDNY